MDLIIKDKTIYYSDLVDFLYNNGFDLIETKTTYSKHKHDPIWILKIKIHSYAYFPIPEKDSLPYFLQRCTGVCSEPVISKKVILSPEVGAFIANWYSRISHGTWTIVLKPYLIEDILKRDPKWI